MCHRETPEVSSQVSFGPACDRMSHLRQTMICVTTRAVCVPRVCHRWDEGHTPADGQLKVSVADPQPSFLTSDSLPMPGVAEDPGGGLGEVVAAG